MDTQNNPVPAGSGQNPYSFIFGDGKNGKRRFGLPNIPGRLKIALGGLVLLVLVIAVFSRSGGSNTSSLIDIAARDHEMLRITTLASTSLHDPQVQNLNSTATSIFTTELQQMANSLGIKTNDSRLGKYLNKNTDAQLATAGQNNNYDSAYLTWLKQSLTAYQQAISATIPTNGVAMQIVPQGPLATDEADAATLLAAPQLKNL